MIKALPNILTLIRPFIPLLAYFPLQSGSPKGYMIAFVILAFSMLSDFFDGFIARRLGLVSDFGKIFDPIVDKVHSTIILVMLLHFDLLPPGGFAVCFIFIFRDFMITGLRIDAVLRGQVVAADRLGKIKTATFCFAILLILISHSLQPLFEDSSHFYLLSFSHGLMYCTTFLTLFSGISYWVKYSSKMSFSSKSL